MQNKILDELVLEVERSSNVSYIVRNPDMFYDIGFKVMKSQEGGSLLNCHRLKYNGNVKLVYFTGDLIPLSQFLEGRNADAAGIVIQNLMLAIETVENNGFLNVVCVDSRLEKIFVEQNTLSIKLIYLPLNVPVSGAAKGIFESGIRAQLVKMLQNGSLSENTDVQKMIGVLTDGTVSLPEIGGKIRTSSYVKKQEKTGAGHYVLAAANGTVNIPITKSEFLIGKSADKADGVIEGNPTISRVHCKVVLQAGKMLIKDMNSANGTMVNGRKINAEEYTALEEGNRVKLANMEFIVRRQER